MFAFVWFCARNVRAGKQQKNRVNLTIHPTYIHTAEEPFFMEQDNCDNSYKKVCTITKQDANSNPHVKNDAKIQLFFELTK